MTRTSPGHGTRPKPTRAHTVEIDQCLLHDLFARGARMVKGNKHYVILPEGEVWRVARLQHEKHDTLPIHILPLPSVLKVKDRNVALKPGSYQEFTLSGNDSVHTRGQRRVSLRTLLRENFPEPKK